MKSILKISISKRLINSIRYCTIILVSCIVLIIDSCSKDDDLGITAVTSAQFYKATLTLATGGREKIMLITEPENAILLNAEWLSSDTSIVKVDSIGVVRAIAAGEAIVSLIAQNNISGECTISVIESPIIGLVMPEARFPVSKEALVFIQGTGFTDNSKIILRKHSNFKSTNSDDDLLMQIHQRTLNYINFYVSANPGWYNVILDENGEEFDLGNMEVEIPNLPEYEYDHNKNFWDDTHWRWFQLRGKVKKVDIAQKDWYTFNGETKMSSSSPKHTVFSFNNIGLLVSELIYTCDKGVPSSTVVIEHVYEYDSQNRIIKENRINKGIPYYTRDFTYGNHNFYYPLGLHLLPGNNNLWGDVRWRKYWAKGLTGITYKSSKEEAKTIFTIGENVISTDYTISSYNTKETFYYANNNNFPSTSTSESIHPDKSRYAESYNYKFSITGIPLNIDVNDCGKSYQIKSEAESPFYLISTKYSTVYKYDNNWNLSENDNGSFSWCYYYTSYDANGNWTECTFITKYTDESIGTIYKLTRDITYW